ncbi:transposase family protein [Ventosimonas gracilis]|nr:transposase family protein [Ventosimonas gracilis]
MSDPTHASVALNAQAHIESAAFLTHFDALVDPRQSGKVIYPLP